VVAPSAAAVGTVGFRKPEAAGVSRENPEVADLVSPRRSVCALGVHLEWHRRPESHSFQGDHHETVFLPAGAAL
jgi:hypothetical protein